MSFTLTGLSSDA
jgi:hypothetical protein